MATMQEHPYLTNTPGFIVKLREPLLTLRDLEVLTWATGRAFMLGPDYYFNSDDEGDDERINLTMALPYDQGPGWLLLYKDPYTPRWLELNDGKPDEELEASVTEEERAQAAQEEADFTGWWFTHGYEDSMTSIFSSPIMRNEDGEFYEWEM